MTVVTIGESFLLTFDFHSDYKRLKIKYRERMLSKVS